MKNIFSDVNTFTLDDHVYWQNCRDWADHSLNWGKDYSKSSIFFFPGEVSDIKIFWRLFHSRTCHFVSMLTVNGYYVKWFSIFMQDGRDSSSLPSYCKNRFRWCFSKPLNKGDTKQLNSRRDGQILHHSIFLCGVPRK